ncbi:phosphate ABC transporter substrate-binding protein PstS [Kineococcus sp. NUM-3379]
MRSPLRRAAVPAALALALGLSACGASNENAGTAPSEGPSASSEAALSGDLNGAGASSQKAAMDAWVAGFTAQNADVNVNYDPAGSGAGREQFLAGAVDFAGSDSYLKDEELEQAKEACAGGEAFDVPVYVSPIAVIYNLPEVKDLQLSAATIAKIFNGTVKTWDAPEIKADNPNATLPATAINPVHRADDSGTTNNFTDYLSKAGEGAWTAEPDGEWPAGLGGEAAQGTSGVVSAVKAGAGSIGYADLSQAGDLGVASVKVGEGYVKPSAETAAAVLDNSPKVEGRPAGDIAIKVDRSTTAANTYPVVLVSYHIACSKYEDAAQGDLVKAFLTYVVSEEGQQAAAEAAGSAPLSSALSTEAAATIEKIGS